MVCHQLHSLPHPYVNRSWYGLEVCIDTTPLNCDILIAVHLTRTPHGPWCCLDISASPRPGGSSCVYYVRGYFIKGEGFRLENSTSQNSLSISSQQLTFVQTNNKISLASAPDYTNSPHTRDPYYLIHCILQQRRQQQQLYYTQRTTQQQNQNDQCFYHVFKFQQFISYLNFSIFRSSFST